MLDGARQAARAIDALRRGWPINVDGAAFLPIETASDEDARHFDPEGNATIIIASARAATLRIVNQRAAADPAAPVAIARAPWHDDRSVRATADPADDLAHPFKGPFKAIALADPASAATALELARLAGILPAFLMQEGREGEAEVTRADLSAYEDPAQLAIVTRARLPVAAAEDAEIVAFRSAAGGLEHVALVIGTPDRAAPLVRLHSECLTGDVFASLKCDCGPQLQAALARIVADGGGILLYLRQEGRGIGLANKLRAYRLQDQGFDTVDANLRLGFAVDSRDFGVAARMLALLGAKRVRLLTNNPAKVAGLEAAGIAVAERVAHALPPNPHNARYLETKRDRTGHQL